MRTFTRTAALGASAALALAALTGCAGGSQSVADACEVVNEGMTEIQSEVQGMATNLQSGDLTGMSELFAKLETKFEEVSGNVTNEEVSAVVTDMHEGLQGFNESLSGAENITDLATGEEFGAAAQKMQAAGTKFTELCS